ncbi:hypothetical protein [Thermoanaerobacterium sp. R66]|uniref:hypothetical protein n=1 Tax=Thermoanaerobacterium sp. R66 TaxID=2742479 RepID=UPI0023802FA7|nr:hypothetical protein [Thermoanaerobacterium sp. R66]MDE4542406.1 hypothetical protein [Thermoanaerobacterium sp. R66]
MKQNIQRQKQTSNMLILGNNVNDIMTPTFIKDTANKLNVSPRTVQNRKFK